MNKEILTLFIMLDSFLLILIIVKICLKDKLLIKQRLTKVVAGRKNAISMIKKPKKKKNNKDAKNIKILLKLENEISSAGLLIRPSEFLMIWCLAAGIPSLILIAISHNMIAAIAAVLIGVFLPPFMLHMKKEKRVELFERQLVEAIAIICNSLRSGLTFQQALISISNEMPEPISKEFGRVVREINLGSNIEKALTNMSERLNSKNFMLIVSAILIQRQIGGNLSDVLSNIAGTIKERFKIKSEIKVLTTTGRSSGIVVGIMPILILLFFMLVNPSYIESFFDTSVGIGMLVAAAILETVGFLIIRKIVNIKY